MSDNKKSFQAYVIFLYSGVNVSSFNLTFFQTIFLAQNLGALNLSVSKIDSFVFSLFVDTKLSLK